jgi:hypothetical protein
MEKSTVISSVILRPKPQTKQQLMEAFYRASLSQKSPLQLGNHPIASHPSGTTTMIIHEIFQTSCYGNCTRDSTSLLELNSETSTQQKKYDENTSNIAYAKVLRFSATKSIDGINETSVEKRKSGPTISQNKVYPNALADDLIVFVLDTVYASSLRVNVQNDEPQTHSNLTSTARLPQSKKITVPHAFRGFLKYNLSII